MRKLLLSAVLLTTSIVASAEMTLTDVPVTFYGKVLGKLNGTEFGLHFGELSLNLTPREQSEDALTRRFDLVKLDNGEDAFSYQMDIPFHQFLDVSSQPEYYRPDELSESLPIGGTEQPLDLSSISFIYDGQSYSATVREPYVPTYEFISSQRADIVRLDLVVDLPEELAADDAFADALYDSFLAGLANDAEKTARTEDYDGDGINNFQEIISGRNPEVNEDRPRLLGDASRLRHVSVLDGIWRPLWMPVADANTTSDKVFIKFSVVPDWIELQYRDTQAAVELSEIMTLADFESGRIWARAKLAVDDSVPENGIVQLMLGEDAADNIITTEVLSLTVKRLSISRKDGLDSRVWLRADSETGNDGLVHGLSGHESDRWQGSWTALQESVSGQDNQNQMSISAGNYLAFSNANEHWRALQEQSSSTLVAMLDATVADQALFSDGFNVVRRLSAGHPQYPEHILVEQPTEGKRWVSQVPATDGWHVISLQTPRKGEVNLWLDGVYSASRSIDIEKKLIQPHPAVGAWYELDNNGTPVVHLASGLTVGEFLGYDRLLESDTIRSQAAYLLAKWRGIAWVDRLGALTKQVAASPDEVSYFVSGGRDNTFTGSSKDDVFFALDGSVEMTGAGGADRFVVGAGSIVKDYTPAEGDVIDLSALLADAIDATDWFDIIAVKVDAASNSTTLSIYPNGVSEATASDTVRKVTISGKTLSKQDLVDFWRDGKFSAGRFRPATQLTLSKSGVESLSEQKLSYRFAEVSKTGAGLPFGKRLPLAFSGTSLKEDYLLEFQSASAVDGSPYLDMSLPENAESLAALDGEIRVRISAKPDSVAEPEETVKATLMPMPEWFDLGENVEVDAVIVDGADQVSISAGITEIGEAEGANPLSSEVILTRNGAIDKALTVRLQTLGNAENGKDYAYIASTAHFQAGSKTVSVFVKSLTDKLVESDEYVEVLLQSHDDYEIVGSDRVKIQIHDAAQTLSLRPIELVTTTQGAVKALVSLERTGVTEGDMTAELSFSGTAVNSVDYQYISPAVSFSGVQTAQIISVVPVGQSPTSLKYLDIEIKPSAQYVLGEIKKVRLYLVTSLTSDEDGDGMPDAWEIRNHLDAFVASAHLDTDGDGLRDLDEFTRNADPNERDTDGDGTVDGADAYPTDKAQTDYIDSLYEYRVSLSPLLARSNSAESVRLKLNLDTQLVESAGITLRVYYDNTKVTLDQPELDASLGVVTSRVAVGDVDNFDNHEGTNVFDEWVFYRGENDWYQMMKAQNNRIALSFKWIDGMSDGERTAVNPYIVATGDPVNWQYKGAELELINPDPLDVDSDGVYGTEDDVRMMLTGFIDDQSSEVMNKIQQQSGTLESEIDEMGERVRVLGGKLDVDGDGKEVLYSDGLLIARYHQGLRGDALIAGAVGVDASRTTAAAIEAYLIVLLGGTEK